MNDALLVVGAIAVIVFFVFILPRLAQKGVNAIETAVRPGAASQSNELLHTVVTFTTKTPLGSVRAAVGQYVEVKGEFFNGGAMAVISDSERGIAWEIGSTAVGSGFIAQLTYRAGVDGGVTAQYGVTKHVSDGGVSPFIDRMLKLRNQVITAFQSADPNVQITTDKQSLSSKTSWL